MSSIAQHQILFSDPILDAPTSAFVSRIGLIGIPTQHIAKVLLHSNLGNQRFLERMQEGKDYLLDYLRMKFASKFLNLSKSKREKMILSFFEAEMLASVATVFGLQHVLKYKDFEAPDLNGMFEISKDVKSQLVSMRISNPYIVKEILLELWQTDRDSVVGCVAMMHPHDVRRVGYDLMIKDMKREYRHRCWADGVYAIISLLKDFKGCEKANAFIDATILNRPFEPESFVEYKAPKCQLIEELKKRNMQPPVYRMIGETGRLSLGSAFVVGVYSGVDKIGEGYSSSIKKAELKAAIDALNQFYLK